MGGESRTAGDRRHDLARLAVTALGDVEVAPRGLHRASDGARDSLDGDHVMTRKPGRRCHARSCGAAVDMDGAGAALGDTASVLGAGQAKLVTQHP
jgi:hypothetical protein